MSLLNVRIAATSDVNLGSCQAGHPSMCGRVWLTLKGQSSQEKIDE